MPMHFCGGGLHHVIVLLVGSYHREETNPPMIKDATGCRPPSSWNLVRLPHWGRDKNDRHFPDDFFKCIFFGWKYLNFYLDFTEVCCQGSNSINNIPALVQIMAWCRPSDKPLSEPMTVSSLTHIYITRPWLKLKLNWNRELSWCLLNCHWWHRRLSLRQPSVPPMATNLAQWQQLNQLSWRQIWCQAIWKHQNDMGWSKHICDPFTNMDLL